MINVGKDGNESKFTPDTTIQLLKLKLIEGIQTNSMTKPEKRLLRQSAQSIGTLVRQLKRGKLS